MKKYLILLSLFLTFGAGCSRDETETATIQETAESAPQGIAVGEPNGEQGAPTQGGAGELAKHALFIASSEDGETWDVNEETIAEKASVGDLIALKQDLGSYEAGTLLSYFVDASGVAKAGEERVSMISSTDDGETWTERTELVINDLPSDLLGVDPSVIQNEDGSLRLYFFDFSIVSGTAQKTWDTNEAHVIYSALSTDGVNFDFEGEVIRRKNVTDPEVVKFGDTWFMYLAAIAENGIAVATSTDGKTFTDTGLVMEMKGIPGSIVVQDEVWVYGCDGGITVARSSDGKTFDEEETILQVPACDPDPAQLSDGSFILLMKGFSTTLNAPSKP